MVMEGKKKKRKRRGVSFLYILGGGILKEDFFIKHIGKIILVVTLMFLLISNRYYCQMKIRKIDALKKELNEVRLESLVISVELTEYSRRSVVEEQMKKQNINLEEATSPPYELKK
ncbi:MAG: hypothetical protein LBJ58_08360 [Tannerellaceae bacterium]|jgi:hypothetical protein|nr:hypothetical protein [Tannerellaceae bacterium]